MLKGFLLDKEILELFSSLTNEDAKKVVEIISGLCIEEKVITKNLFVKYFDKLETSYLLKGCGTNILNFFKEVGYNKNNAVKKEENEEITGKIRLISAPAFPQKKIEVKDFVKHFRSRYEIIRSFLENKNLDNLSSIRKIGEERSNYTIIAAVVNKKITKNKNLFIEVEDLTGNIFVLVNQNKKEVFEKARELLEDDIVAFSASGNREILFANDIIFPEAVLEEKKYGILDEYVAFTSDFHAGSKMFLEKNLLKFVRWLNGCGDDEKQNEIAKKVKYLFIVGDNIDGVGHMPGQERLLIEKTTTGQYEIVEKILNQIRKDIKIIMCPGQHDSVWVGEPQPIIGERWAPGLHKINNLLLVPNPAMVEIDDSFKILMYHGASINRFIDEIPAIRTMYGHDRPTLVVKEMVKRRHLAPVHGLMDYIPCEKGDSLVIKDIPDIIATGDQHRAEVSNYNNILLIASSCWQSTTPFEEKVGNNPDPCKVPLFNLKTREVKILDFSDEIKENSSHKNDNKIFCEDGKKVQESNDVVEVKNGR
ncbi:MAG: metallophosphoesterase [archaeon]